MVSSDAGRMASTQLLRACWFLHAYVVEQKLCALRDAVVQKYDPNQPRVPAGNPDGGQWTDGSGNTGGRLPSGPGTLLDLGEPEGELIRVAQNLPRGHLTDVVPRPKKLPRDIQSLSDIPEEKPVSIQVRNAIIKFVAYEVAELVVLRAAVQGSAGEALEREVYRSVGRTLIGLKVAGWVIREGLSSIASYYDPPRTLEELQDAAAAGRRPGYEIHHIVERNAEREVGADRIHSPENRVSIPIFKHHSISGWYSRKNFKLGDVAPRNYLRGKSWEERTRMGLEALIREGVLKP